VASETISPFFSILFIIVPLGFPRPVFLTPTQLSWRCATGVSSEKVGISISKFSPDSLTI